MEERETAASYAHVCAVEASEYPNVVLTVLAQNVKSPITIPRTLRS